MENLIDQLENLSLNLIKSSRKKKDSSTSYLLVDDESYEYKISYESKEGKITWRCSNTEFPNCKGAVYTHGHKKPIHNLRPHEHCATIKTQVKAIQANIRDLAEKQPDTKPRQIIMESK